MKRVLLFALLYTLFSGQTTPPVQISFNDKPLPASLSVYSSGKLKVKFNTPATSSSVKILLTNGTGFMKSKSYIPTNNLVTIDFQTELMPKTPETLIDGKLVITVNHGGSTMTSIKLTGDK